jgi:hypothetical protein
MPERSDQFEAEVALLRDRVLVALERALSGQASEGLAAYRDLLLTAVTSYQSLQADDIPAAAPATDTYGPEHGILIRDLYDFAEVMRRPTRTRTWIDFCSFLYHILYDAARTGAIAAVSRYLDVAVAAFQGTLQRGAEYRDPYDQDALLLRLRDLVWTTSYQRDESVQREVRRHAAAGFTKLAKAAIDAGDEGSAIFCLRYFAEAFSIDWREPRSTSEEHKFIMACCLELYAWYLLRLHEDAASEHRARVSQWFETTLRQGDTWRALLALQSEAVEPYLHATWWELAGPGPSRARNLVLGTFELVAGLRTHLRPPRPDNADAADVALAARLLRTYEALSSAQYESLRNKLEWDLSGQPLAASLSAIVEEANAQQRQELINAPLDAALIERFRSALRDELDPRRLDRLLNILPVDDVESVAQPSDGGFGWDGRVPKSTFVADGDATWLANSIGAAMRRGENDMIMDLVTAVPGEVLVPTLGRLVELIEEYTSHLGHPELALVITNTWQAADLLTSGADTSDNVLKTNEGHLLYRVFDDRQPFVLVLHRDEAVAITRHPVQPALPGDEYLEDVKVLVGVAPLRENEVEQLKAHGSSESEVRATVRVRVLERLFLEVRQPDLIVRFSLPEGTW